MKLIEILLLDTQIKLCNRYCVVKALMVNIYVLIAQTGVFEIFDRSLNVIHCVLRKFTSFSVPLKTGKDCTDIEFG